MNLLQFINQSTKKEALQYLTNIFLINWRDNLSKLQQRKLYKVLKKRTLQDHRTRLYLIFKEWIEIRKQKDRRKRRTQKKLYKIQRSRELGLRTAA